MTQPRRLWWKVLLLVLLIFISTVLFAAYLRPDMLVMFNDLMALCASLLR